MCTFIAPEKVVGAALALSPESRVSESELGELETYIYSKAPHYTLTFSAGSVSHALSAYRDIFSIDANDSFYLVDGENGKASAKRYFLDTMERELLGLITEYFTKKRIA